MLEHGFLRVARLGGVDVRLHWSLPLGALVFGSARLEPVLWLGFLGVILVHELGHVLLVKLSGLRVFGVDATGFGGHCRISGAATGLQRSAIAWGGVLAQIALLFLTALGMLIVGKPQGHFWTLIVYAFIQINLWIIAINLLPFAPLDGAQAWRLFRELRASRLTLSRALLGPLALWARRRRQVRSGEGTSEPLDSRAGGALGATESHGEDAPTLVSVDDPEDDDDPRPSADAQRELAALFERIAEAAARARRRP
jgi:stage IV sporulation protein FB